MNTLAKDHIAHLAPEQQETVATLDAQRIKKRQQLLEYAHGYRWQGTVTTLLVLSVLSFSWYFAVPVQILVALAFGGLWLLIQVYTACIHRRLDALMELLESDEKDETR